MQVDIEVKPISKRDYETLIRILAKMLASFINEQNKTNKEVSNAKQRLLQIHPENNPQRKTG